MSSRLKEIAEKKGDILSKILKVDIKSLREAKAGTRSKRSQSSSSGMETQVISNIQNRINNPLFSLTIADYELMCGNKVITKMMSKVLECDEKQLKKFCKYINVFKENIKSSPKSIKNKMKPVTKMTLNKLPEELRTQIVQKYMTLFPTKYKLKDWIPPEKLRWEYLSENPNAIDLLKENQDKIDWARLSINPNDEAIEILKANRDKIWWGWLSRLNTNPKAIELLKANPNEIYWDGLSENPAAIKLLKENQTKIYWPMFSLNPNNEAIELLKANPRKINWFYLSKNPNPAAIKLLKENPTEIHWNALSENPSAIELLKKNPKKIYWENLSINSSQYAIELLKANQRKIHGYRLSQNKNPNAIELLKTNQSEIDWDMLSANPAIFEEVLE